jgi:hypothetical protein
VTGGWRKLHNEELHNLYSSPNIIVIKSRRMRWVGHVAGTGEMRNTYKILVGKPEGYRPPEIPRRRYEDNIKMILEKRGLRMWIRFIWLRIGTVGYSCGHGNEPSGSTKDGNFLTS